MFLEEGSELSGREFRMKVRRNPEEMGGIIGEHAVVSCFVLVTSWTESGAEDRAASLGRRG
jgi:hypothetical protein